MLTRIEWSKLHQADRGGSFLKLIKVTAPHFRLVRRKRRRIEPLNLAEPSLERGHIGFAGEFLHRKACRVHAPLFFKYFCKLRRLKNGEFVQRAHKLGQISHGRPPCQFGYIDHSAAPERVSHSRRRPLTTNLL